MPLCASGLLVSALILIVILNDIISNRIDYIPEHFFLGTIICVLFFTLCNYGLEQVNWVFLVLIPVIFFVKWIYTPPQNSCLDNRDACEMCDISEKNYASRVKTTGCKPTSNPSQQQGSSDSSAEAAMTKNKTSGLNCPGNPVSLPTACGISRYA
jgi:hypothetical protein